MNDTVLTSKTMPSSVSGGDRDRRKLSWLRLLEDQIEKYTHGESSSVPLETAGSLLRSVLYTSALAQGGGTESEKQPEVLYGEGRELLVKLIKKAQRLYYLVQSTMLPVDAPCYREAIEKGIPSFFRAYDPGFAAQETPGDFDYPASIFSADTGITWILHFLDTLYWENLFCRRFPLVEVEQTLKAQGILSVAIPVNVFEPVFAAALYGYLFTREGTASLAVHAADNKQLLQSLIHLSAEGIFHRVRDAYDMLIEDMEINNRSFRALLMRQADALMQRLVPAVRHGDVSGVFPPWESPPQPVLMMDGDPMENEAFRALAGEITACRHFSDKLLLVRRQVRCLYDLTGLMENCCFDVQEMRRMFLLFHKEELAALMRMGRGTMLLQGRWIFPDEEDLPQEATLWERNLYWYLNNIDTKQRKEIVDLAGQLQMPT